MTVASVMAGRATVTDPLRRASLFAFVSATCIAAVALGTPAVGLLAIVAFGLPNAYYNAVMPAWCAERYGHFGQGAVMGLLSTIFCLANIVMAVLGALLTLIDTRLILLVGATLAAWAAWRIRQWRLAPANTLAAPMLTP